MVSRASQAQALQLLEQEVREEEELQQEALVADATEVTRLAALVEGFERGSEQRAKGAELRQELLRQAEQSKADKLCLLEEERRNDRRLIDFAVARARGQDHAHFAGRRALEAEVRQQLDRLMLYRDGQRQTEVSRERQAERCAEAWRQQTEGLAEEWARQRHAAEEARASVLARLAAALRAQSAEAAQLEALREALHNEERLAQERLREEADLRRQLAMRSGQAAACREGLRRLQERRAVADQEESEWRAQFLEHLAQEDRIEQLGQRRRQALLVEHRREAERLAAERRRREEDERRREEHELAWQQHEQEESARIIDGERRRLLAEHQQVVHEMYDLLACGARAPLCNTWLSTPAKYTDELAVVAY